MHTSSYCHFVFFFFVFFFFNDTATTEIYTLSLPTLFRSNRRTRRPRRPTFALRSVFPIEVARRLDRKSTRLNSSHTIISYPVFCLKKTARSLPPPRPNARYVPRLSPLRPRSDTAASLFFFRHRAPTGVPLFPSPPFSLS